MRAVASALSLALVCGCAGSLGPQPVFHSLAGPREGAVPARLNPASAASALTLVVSPPHAAAGLDSRRIVYARRADQPEYFAHNEWIETPARMLAPLIVAALARSAAFRAVVQTPSPAGGELRLDTEVLRLQQEFMSVPSQVRFTLRAYVVESATRRVIATREFEVAVPAASDDPRGGVVAARRAVQIVLEELAQFCAEAARQSGGAPDRVATQPG